MKKLVHDSKSKQNGVKIADQRKKEALTITTDKKNRTLQKLKPLGAPFVHCHEMDEFTNDPTVSEILKQDRPYSTPMNRLYQKNRNNTDNTRKSSMFVYVFPRIQIYSDKEKYKNLPSAKYS